MNRKVINVIVILLVCMFYGNIIADDEDSDNRIMNYLAVMDLDCGKVIGKKNCETLTNMVIDELVSLKKYKVVDRANRDKILGEVGFQMTGCVDESCTIEAGKLLGVGKIVVGSIDKLGATYVVTLQLLNVESATVEASAKEKCKKCEIDDLIDTVTNAARKLMGKAPNPITSSSGTTKPSGTKGGEMVKVPAGEFIMGSSSAQIDEALRLCGKKCKRKWFENETPQHRVFLDEFYIDKYEVTNKEYAQCVSAGPCSANKKYDNFTNSQQPVVGVDWNQADTYCKWAGKRLPTEAEWEKAARGTDGRTFPWGEGIDCSKANYGNCKHGKTKPVGSYSSGASPYGAMDMAGNVWEWCSDWYGENYYSGSPNRNPKGPYSGASRVVRGGSWLSYPYDMRTSYRRYSDPSSRSSYFGLRCSRTP